MTFRLRKTSSSLSRTRSTTSDASHSTHDREAPPVPPVPAAFLAKPYVSNALKYLDDDAQRARALQVAAQWRDRFASGQWKDVVAGIARAKKGIFPEPEMKSNRSTGADAVAFTTPCAVSVSGSQNPPSQRETANSAHTYDVADYSVPRKIAWPGKGDDDDLPRLRLRLLSWPIPQARQNAFTDLGYWELDETERHASIDMLTDMPSYTPLSALPLGSISPTRKDDAYRPKDTTSRAAYDRVLTSISATESADIASEILYKHPVDTSVIPIDVPTILARFAEAEREVRIRTTLHRPLERIIVVNGVPQFSGGEDCLDELMERREELKKLVAQKEKAMDVCRDGVRGAWALCVAERFERHAQARGESTSSSEGDDGDDGYEYGNFLQHMRYARSEAVASTRSAASRSRGMSESTTANNSTENHSPSKDSRESHPEILQSPYHNVPRLSASSTANNSPTKSPRRALRYDPPTPYSPRLSRCSADDEDVSPLSSPSKSPRRRELIKKEVEVEVVGEGPLCGGVSENEKQARLSNEGGSGANDNSSTSATTHHRARPPLVVRTSRLDELLCASKTENSTSQSSPAEKEERRRGPHMHDLNNWALELKLKGLVRNISGASMESERTVVRDGDETSEHEERGSEEADQQMIPLPPPSAIFPESWPARVESMGEMSDSLPLPSASSSVYSEVLVTARRIETATDDPETPGDHDHEAQIHAEKDAAEGQGTANGEIGTKQEDTKKMSDAEREWLAEMQRLTDQEMERQARERQRELERIENGI